MNSDRVFLTLSVLTFASHVSPYTHLDLKPHLSQDTGQQRIGAHVHLQPLRAVVVLGLPGLVVAQTALPRPKQGVALARGRECSIGDLATLSGGGEGETE